MAVPEEVGFIGTYTGTNPLKLHTEYMGATVLLLVALGFRYARRNRYFWFFFGLALFTLSISFGGHTPIYRLYYELLPGTKKFRAPSVSLFLLSMSMVAMATITLEALASMLDARNARRTLRARTEPDPQMAPATWIMAGWWASASCWGSWPRRRRPARRGPDPARSPSASRSSRWRWRGCCGRGWADGWARRRAGPRLPDGAGPVDRGTQLL
jgi:hypothetical protein